ncbi:MAG: histidinol-phosphatase HisJ family protein [Fusobacteriaceae bacterium]|jgi:histidinol-phosphatase (PHP family)|nr:histidinol-phosphatase HisJ family protein [Fusobacteriaceae bacterium]
MYYSDYHLHSNFSPDSKQDIDELVKKAISVGLKEIAITDHFEYDVVGFEEDFCLDLPRYSEKVLQLKSKYKSQIIIRMGVEIGAQPQLTEYFAAQLKEYPFDFVIASCHTIDKVDLYFCKVQEGRTLDEVQDIYFNNILKVVSSYDCFSVFGHLDYVTRYGGEKFRQLNYERQKKTIDKILTILIEKGKGIEINTSGFRYNEGRFYPHKDIIKRYFELGGEIITVGSDAHKASDIVKDFDKAYAFLSEIGIKYISIFENMKASFLKI